MIVLYTILIINDYSYNHQKKHTIYVQLHIQEGVVVYEIKYINFIYKTSSVVFI